MILLRVIAFSLPQILLLMLLAAALDLLSGWNHTDAGFGTLIFLFLLNPVVVIMYLIAELLHYHKLGKQPAKQRTFILPGLAIVIVVEVLATNLYLLSQVKM